MCSLNKVLAALAAAVLAVSAVVPAAAAPPRQEEEREWLVMLYQNADDEVLEVSSIFDWYSGDFEKGFLGADSVEAFLVLYVADLGLDARVAKALREGDVDLDYTDYDWRLNRAE